MGHSEVTDAHLSEIFAKVDMNKNGVVEWAEFLHLMQYIKLSDKKPKAEAFNLRGLGAAAAEIGEGGSQSTYLLEEVSALARFINNTLKDEPALAERLPMDPDNDDLFNTCSDGLVLIYLLNIIDPSLVDM